MTESLRVVAAAILHDGQIYSLRPPARHHNVGIHMVETGACAAPYPGGDAQGFLLSDGRFARRRAALSIAERAGQLIREPTAPGHGLFSEDVW